jgi:16S rRNA (cytidine1402-2'-O)-methyltransferase
MAPTPGTLYLVGTPIGNLEDITLRAVRVLREVDLIAAEDTRVTRTLLERYQIGTPLTSFHEHSRPRKIAEIIAALQQGKSVAVVSDAGMPAISDPGADLVAACVQAGLPVAVVPGPTAVATALAASGFLAQEYLFLGFLPNRKGPRRETLLRAAQQPGALVCFEGPHRLVESLTDMQELLGDREAVCARELTKKFEEFVRGRLSELAAHFGAQPPRGEMTVVVKGEPVREARRELAEGAAEAKDLVALGLSASRAAAHVAKWRRLPRRAVYQSVAREQKDE